MTDFSLVSLEHSVNLGVFQVNDPDRLRLLIVCQLDKAYPWNETWPREQNLRIKPTKCEGQATTKMQAGSLTGKRVSKSGPGLPVTRSHQ